MTTNLPAIPKRGNLPAISTTINGRLPAVVTQPTRRPIRALNKFAERAEDLALYEQRLHKAFRDIKLVTRYPHDDHAHGLLDGAADLLAQYDSRFRELAAELKRDGETFHPADAYDEDGNLTEARVRQHIGLLLASIPAGAKAGNPEVYLGMMVEEVMAQEGTSLAALESACSQIRLTLKFQPSIAEVIDAIVDQDNLWSPRWSAVDDCADYAEELRDELKIATELVAAEKAKREQQRLAYEEEKRIETERLHAAHVAVGDRVRHITAGGVGTVVGDDVPGRANYCSVRSDKSGRLIDVDRQYLEKLALT